MVYRLMSGCLLLLFFGQAWAGCSTDTTTPVTIPLMGNGYIYDVSKSADENTLDEKGWTNWTDQKVFGRVFFYPQKKTRISVSVKVKVANASVLKFRLDSTSQVFTVTVKPSDNYVIIPVGTFNVSDARYHFIQINGISKSGARFPDIQSLLFSDVEPGSIVYNSSDYRGAPATHLSYPVVMNDSLAWFYTEVKVPVGVNAVNAYYMTNGFNGGYMGVQINNPKERRIIFSIWSNYSTDNPKEIPAEYAVKLVKKGNGVITDAFGNEGSGGHSHLVFDWKNGETYKMLVGAKASGDHTIYTAYFYAPENKSWKLVAQWDKAKTGGKLLSGLYSFVENFGPNGNDFFKALYGNQWVCTTAGKWIELTHAVFSTTADAQKHPVFDYGGGVEDNWFYMYSGGFRFTDNIKPRDMIARRESGKSPDIDFAALPDK